MDNRKKTTSLSNSFPNPPGTTLPSDVYLSQSLSSKTLFLIPPPSSQKSLKPSKRPKKKKKQSNTGNSHFRRRPAHKLPSNLEAPSLETLGLLHGMWKEYAEKALDGVGKGRIGEAALRLDLHGARIRVVAARHAGFVGVCGILVAETAEMVLLGDRKSVV